MENASKALLMAGAILIAILLLTLFVYITRQMADSASEIYDVMEQSNIAEFNQKFLNYQGKGENYNQDTNPNDYLTAQDVATIINLAKDYNKSPQFTQESIKVYVGASTEDYTSKTIDEIYEWIQANLDKKYKCRTGNISINTSTLVVEKITIEEITI